MAERDAIDDGDIGEIEIRGLSMVTGYYGDTSLGDECWLLTGDLGYLADDRPGAAFLVDETPIGRWWRDMKLARVGGGIDEVLWELMTAGLKPDHAGYEVLFGRSNA